MRCTKVIVTALMPVPVMFLLLLPGSSAPEKPGASGTGDIILGVDAGYAGIHGYYSGRFRASYRVGASLLYGNPAIVRFLMGELDIAYGRYPMKQDTSSFLQRVSVSAGPVAWYPAAPWLHLYLGAYARGSYLHLFADTTGRNVKALKPGFAAKSGFFFPVGLGFRFRLGVEYTLEYLSGRPLHGINVTGGLSYNFNPAERSERVLAVDAGGSVEWYLPRAERALAAGRTDEARRYYDRVLAIDRDNPDAMAQVAAIQKAEKDYARAMKLSEQKRHVEALPLLDSAARYLDRARRERETVRKLLAVEIPSLEKQGVALYENGDYRGCIAVMNRLLLIDPKNRTGLIYLPRAMKRQGALERLR